MEELQRWRSQMMLIEVCIHHDNCLSTDSTLAADLLLVVVWSGIPIALHAVMKPTNAWGLRGLAFASADPDPDRQQLHACSNHAITCILTVSHRNVALPAICYCSSLLSRMHAGISESTQTLMTPQTCQAHTTSGSRGSRFDDHRPSQVIKLKCCTAQLLGSCRYFAEDCLDTLIHGIARALCDDGERGEPGRGGTTALGEGAGNVGGGGTK